MMENWYAFNFEQETPKVSITSVGTTFNKGVVQILNYPKYIQLLFNEEKKLMAVKPCTDPKEKHKIEFYKNKDKKYVRYNYENLKKHFENLLNVDLQKNIIKCNGEFQNGMVIFNLAQSKIL